MQRAKRILFGLAIAGIAVSTSRPARADWDLQIATMMGGGWLKSTPTFEADDVPTHSRSIRGGDVRTSGGGLGMMGWGLDSALTIDDRWQVPIVGFASWWAVGNTDAQVSSLDGSVAKLKPWTTFRGDVLLPGFGRRFKYRRETVSIALQTGVSWMKMDGTVASGNEVKPLNLSTTTFLLQAEVEGCRRLDPTMRLCFSVAPRLYESRWLNGVTFGLRVEWGR